MKRSIFVAVAWLLLFGTVNADEPWVHTPELLADWQWYQEVKLPSPLPEDAYLDFILPPSVFGKARQDLRDLRVYDAAGREVEYALRVRQTRDEQVALAAKPYNRVVGPNRTAEVRLDLGAGAIEHNALEIDSAGNNVRRWLRVEGSDTDGDWRELIRARFVRLEYGGQRIEVKRFQYAASRFRYLRITLEPDPTMEGDTPEISSMRVFRWVQTAGEDLTLDARLSPREPTPGDGGPGSAWLIDLGGNTPPVAKLLFDVADTEFVRPYRLELLYPEGGITYLSGGEWRRRANEEARPLEVTLPNEVRPYKFRLVVTDHRNKPLNLRGVRCSAPARQVVIPAKADLKGPLRLYFGNPRAEEPGYDFARALMVEPKPTPIRLTVGESATEQPRSNPIFQPEPPPLTERFPWAVYVVLMFAVLGLLGILTAMGRQVIARHDSSSAG